MAENETDFGTPCPHCGALPCIDGTRIHELLTKLRSHADTAERFGRTQLANGRSTIKSETWEIVQALRACADLVENILGWK